MPICDPVCRGLVLGRLRSPPRTRPSPNVGIAALAPIVSALGGARLSLRALRRISFSILSFLVGTAGFAVEPVSGSPERLVGGEFLYSVRPGDSLTRIGARFGVEARLLAGANGLSFQSVLSVGQTVRVENRHIVPTALEQGILINVPQRLLFLFQEGKLVAWYPVGLGRPDWQTATGHFEVAEKERAPTWHVPVSIQEEMRRHGEPVRTEVPPGPANPLGDFWIGLSRSTCGIHGTNAPASVYAFRTHGCVRLHPEDIADLFSRVAPGTPVWIAYETVLLARTPGGAVFLEVNRDIYRRARTPRAAIEGLVAEEVAVGELDEARIIQVAASQEGLARRVDRH
jgi:L,D-transpeptidase ErfK/SrfK